MAPPKIQKSQHFSAQEQRFCIPQYEGNPCPKHAQPSEHERRSGNLFTYGTSLQSWIIRMYGEEEGKGGFLFHTLLAGIEGRT